MSGPHLGLDSSNTEKSITQLRKPQRVRKQINKKKRIVKNGKGRAGEIKVLSKSREIIRGICKQKEQPLHKQPGNICMLL